MVWITSQACYKWMNRIRDRAYGSQLKLSSIFIGLRGCGISVYWVSNVILFLLWEYAKQTVMLTYNKSGRYVHYSWMNYNYLYDTIRAQKYWKIHYSQRTVWLLLVVISVYLSIMRGKSSNISGFSIFGSYFSKCKLSFLKSELIQKCLVVK